MPFKPGDKRPTAAGRRKGTPNKRTQVLFEKAEALGVDPFDILLRFANGDWEGLGYKSGVRTKVCADGGTIEVDVIEPELRAHCAEKCCSYLYPKPKAVTLENADGSPIIPQATALTFDQQLKLLQVARGEK